MPVAGSNQVVLKFGGTSVSSRERWETIGSIIRKQLEDGEKPFVVCSALSGISNLLEKLLKEAVQGNHQDVIDEIERRHVALAAELDLNAGQLLGPYFEELERMALGASLVREVSPRLHARILATGELMSTTLGAAFLKNQGIDLAWLDARDVLRAVEEPNVSTSRRYLSATCSSEPDPDLQQRLSEGSADAHLTQGFIARNAAGDTVLLGRGGSDTSAAYFAAILEAGRLEIWTDVPGMFTANPHQIPAARLLRQLHYNEAQELATTGGKVLHPRCLDPVRRYGIPLHIRCTLEPDMEGTRISNDVPDFGAQVKAISSKKGITLISMETIGMWQQVGFLSDIFSVFTRNGLSVDLVTTSESNITVSLDPVANAFNPDTIKSLLRDLSAYCTAREVSPCASVSLVGRNIRSVLHELGPALEVFDEQQIYMVSQAASDLNLSFVVDEAQADRLVRKLHAQLFANRLPDELLGPTWQQLFGKEPVQAAAEQVWWRKRQQELVEIGRRASPVYVYDEATLRHSARTLRSLQTVDRIFYSVKANPNADILRLFNSEGLSFECVSPGEVEHVRQLFPGIDPSQILFTPNFAPREEYVSAFEVGVHVTVDNLFPLEMWPEVFEGREIIVRIDPGRGRGHHKYVRTAGPQSKFGIAPTELDELKRLADRAGARVIGFHAHVGSGIRIAETWAETGALLVSLTDRFPDVRLVNMGGGLGVVEHPGTTPLDMEAVNEGLTALKSAHPGVDLWLEPGRFLVAPAGVLLTRVTQLKKKGNVHYVGLDTGMNSLIRPALYGAYHEIVNLSRLDAPVSSIAEVVGPICETGDVLGHGRPLPETREGDVFLIATAGAYGRAMSSFYNLREPASEELLPVFT